MSKLIIDNVDLKLLEYQRLALVRLLGKVYPAQEDLKTRGDIEICQGLLNMLDEWSDSIFIEVSVEVKEWRDKVNGNSYWSSRVSNSEGGVILTMPMQYGYGDHGLDETFKALARLQAFPSCEARFSVHSYCEAHNIKYTYNKHENCLKRDVKSFGEQT